MIITNTLNKAQADELFDQEAILFATTNGIPEYRVAELFGKEMAEWVANKAHSTGYMEGGRDWNGAGACSDEEPFITYYYRAGFHKIVSKHNYWLTVKKHKASEGGKIVDTIWKAHHEALEAAEAEEERKREERRAKRAASRKAKQETTAGGKVN